MAVSIQTDAEPIPGYRLLDRLGSGGFGEVWRCVAPGGIFKAVKVVHGDIRQTDDDAHRFAEQELKALKRVKAVRHPYLLALDRFDIVDGRLLIVMELADRNLWDRFRECRGQGLPGIPRDELMGYMAECGEVLDLMNIQYSLQHLDIKPQNLFLLYNHVKVADFGQVKDLEKHVAQVTGGITPVYAAPETFDGFVSRYCDQYSLACVYQELLTGHRPFDGQSMQQLLMQHLQAPPNLAPSPPADRPALARALAKSPDDRFPTIAALVAALRTGSAGERVAVPVAMTVGGSSFASARGESDGWREAAGSGPIPAPAVGRAVAVVESPEQTYFPRQPSEALSASVERAAAPEQLGEGPIRPALVLGVGHTGFRVVQRLRRRLDELYGRAERVPAVRTLYIDTDPEALDAAVAPAEDGGTPFPPEAIIPLRLNRAAHYLKPRNNGRMLIEGWFDPETLYRLPRVPTTMGLRSLGRLAFCDHYRAAMQKLSAELDACLAPDAVAATCGITGQPIRTNRPRVYVVAGLGGGTGGGLSLDLAYAVRAKLKRIGYANPDVVAVFLTPADGPGEKPTDHARANTYATLTELHHYSHPDTAYLANFDDRHGAIVDNDPPFSRVYLLPGLPYPPAAEGGGGSGVAPPAARGSGSLTATPARRTGTPLTRSGLHRRPAVAGFDPTEPVAEFVRLDLFTSVGISADDAGRPAPSPAEVRTFGLQRFGWPRAEVVGRVARLVSPVLLGHWVAPDPGRLRAVVSKWTGDLWLRLALNPDRLTARLRGAADAAAGLPLDQWAKRIAEPFAPKGWLSRSPAPALVARAADDLTAAIGPPRENAAKQPTLLDDALDAAAAEVAAEVRAELARLIPQLHDTPEFRVAGTEEAVRQLLLAVDRSRGHIEPQVAKWEATAVAAYDRLKHYSFPQKGVRKATPTEVADALHAYPTDWLQVLTGRRAVAVYARLHEVLLHRLAELSECRRRLEELHAQLLADAEPPAAESAGMLPVGCATVEEAARRFTEVLNDDDLAELERRFQTGLELAFGGVFEASLNSAEGPEAVLRILREATCDYLDGRLGDVDLAGMAKQKFGSSAGVRQELQRLYADAHPKGIGGGPWTKAEVTVFAAPPGAGGSPLVQQASTLLPPSAVVTDTHDEVVVYREYPGVPLAALPQLGPAWQAAYQNSRDFLDTTPHTRADITQWLSVDG